MRIDHAAALAALMAVLGTGPAHAVPVTFSFAGSVTNDPFGLSSFGAPITGSYTFDSTATDAIANPNTGSYPSTGLVFGFAANVDGTDYAVPGTLTVNIANNIGVDQYGVIATDGTLTLELFFEDATQTALATDALALTPPALGDFASRQFRLFSPDAEFFGSVDVLTCTAGCVNGGGGGTAPEPPTTWLLALSLVSLLARRLGER